MGRPTKLNAKTQALILKYIRKGCSYLKAAQCAGISEQTFITWRKRAEKEEKGIYYEFLEKLKIAEAKGIARNLDIIQKAADGGTKTIIKKRTHNLTTGEIIESKEVRESEPKWLPSAWVLERRHPEDFGKNEKLRTEFSAPKGDVNINFIEKKDDDKDNSKQED